MSRRSVFVLALRLACMLLPLAAARAEPARLPTEAFARPPQLQQVALSPDGTWFAAVLNREGDSVAIARPLDGSVPPRALLKSDNRESRLAYVHWLDNQRLVVSVHYPAFRGGVPTTESRLVAVGRDGSKPVTLVDPAALAWNSAPQRVDEVVDWLPGDGHHILLQAAVDATNPSPAVFRVDTDTGRREPVHGRRFGVRHWIADAAHRVRVGVQQQGTQVQVLVCDADGANWRTAWSFELFSREAVRPMGFGSDPDKLVVSAEHEGRRAVFEVDLRDPALPRRLLLAEAQQDLSERLLRDDASGRAVGVVGGGTPDGLVAQLWDTDAKALGTRIDAALPGRFNRLLQFSAEGGRYLVYSSGNGQPGQFLVGDRAGGTLSLVGKLFPDLPAERMVQKTASTVTSRDGLRLPVLLTLPPGVPAQRLPTVLLPHGGPVGADTLDFDPLAQFLAQRGYAVLQVNFRGSSGQGYDFVRAGLKRWGLEMQDDLSDALQWLVQRGIADPARACIVGGSYGGYAALMGGARTPDQFRCVVSLAGVSDLPALAAYQSRYVNGSEVFALQIGAAFGDRAQLEATSPARLAQDFRAPVLLLHGTLDRSVPFAQSQSMAEALKQAGKEVRFVTLEQGDHTLGHAPHRLQFYRELEDFLAQHLAPR